MLSCIPATSACVMSVCQIYPLLRRQDLESCSNLLLPAHLVLAEDLGANWEVLATFWQESCARDDGVRAHGSVLD